MSTERPILFSAPMVRAILAGEKTVTRRVVNVDRLRVKVPEFIAAEMPLVFGDTSIKPGTYRARMNPQGAVSIVRPDGRVIGVKPAEFSFASPYSVTGDRLWVRETWQTETNPSDRDVSKVRYRADGEAHLEGDRWTWRPSIFMPRWASRLSLDVVSVRVERLHDITAAEVLREGVCLSCDAGGTVMTRITGKHPPVEFLRRGEEVTVGRLLVAEFASLWSQINSFGSWDANPWVWRVEFIRPEVPRG